MAAYGPDATLATKLVVSVVKRPGRGPSPVRTWTTQAVDVRRDTCIGMTPSGISVQPVDFGLKRSGYGSVPY
jgi:hypothetical protein